MKTWWIRRTPDWLDIYFNPSSRLRIQSTSFYWLWISWGYRAEYQFTINRGWLWEGYYPRGKRDFEFLWFAFRKFD